MGTLSAIFCRGEIVFMFIVLSVSAMTVSAQVAEEFQKCVTSCLDDKGNPLTVGNYPHCDRCEIYVSCDSQGNLYIRDCALGTNFFNRKLGVCDVNISVCVNDSLSTTHVPITRETTTLSSTIAVLDTTITITTATTTTTPTTTTTTTTDTTATTPTTTATIPTTATTATTHTTTTTTTATTPTTATTLTTHTTTTTTTTPTTTTATTPTTATTTTAATSQALPTSTTASVIQTSTSRVTTTSTNPTVPTTTTVAVIDTSGYTPRPGREADSFLFAIEFYNNNSQDAARVGALAVDSFTGETLNGNGPGGFSGNHYRIYGVTLVHAQCPNKPEFSKADYTRCPLLSPANVKQDQYVVAKCDFKVWNPLAGQLDMVYLMCRK
ncbi:hypothetical protein BsWGS_15475 [Bradybaena similaris]